MTINSAEKDILNLLRQTNFILKVHHIIFTLHDDWLADRTLQNEFGEYLFSKYYTTKLSNENNNTTLSPVRNQCLWLTHFCPKRTKIFIIVSSHNANAKLLESNWDQIHTQ